MATGAIFIVSNGQISKNKIAIWSYWHFSNFQDLSAFAMLVDLPKVKLNNRGLMIYHVSPTLPDNEKSHVSPSRFVAVKMTQQFAISYTKDYLATQTIMTTT